MSAAGTPSSDPWVIVSRERMRYEDQFKNLNPLNGIITGEQAKGFLLQSKLPPAILGQIWGLADTNADGKMDINEFSIACKLINLKLRGFDIPQVLPPTLIASLQMYTQTPAVPPLPIQQPQVLSNGPPITGLQNLTKPQSMGAFVNSLISGLPPPITNTSNVSLLGGTMPQNVGVSHNNPSNIGLSNIPTANGIPLVMPVATIGSTVSSNISGIPLIPPVGVGQLAQSASVPIAPPVGGIPIIPHSGSGPMVPLVGQPPSIPSAPGSVTSVTSTPRASVGSLDQMASVESPLVEWSVPHQSKLKYTQIFNTTDRSRTGYLSGVQARNVMVHTKLPQNILAQIWALSDMDADGRLSCEEFVLAMHLCEQAALGTLPPIALPPDLIPPSFRRGARTNSMSSQGSAPLEVDPASTLITTTFEDKRKENFEKGQAELDRRRKTLFEQQRKEAEERERKEREEIERREKARQDAERRRLEELEKQMREQQELERLKEEDRKRQVEQREIARREMERQRQLEWEKQRSQELQQQRQREQENVLKLKAKNQGLTIELSSLNDQIKDLSQKICDTRMGVSNVKTTIDGMRSTRDSQMQEMSQLKNKLKEQNAKLLALSQEKVKLEAKSKQMNESDQSFNNQEINIKNLREKIDDMQSQIDGKMSDIENNNAQLNDLKAQLAKLLEDCENLYNVYEQKRDTVLDMKNSAKNEFITSGWDQPKTDFDWPADNNWKTEDTVTPATLKYRAIYEFEGRNNDEISFQPGDIIAVPIEQSGEPGWLAGEIRGRTGWFPESYVELLNEETVNCVTVEQVAVIEEVQTKERLQGIAEIPESQPSDPVVAPVVAETPLEVPIDTPLEYYIASYPYQSVEQGDLSFNAGDIVGVIKKEGDWWTGKLGDNVGIFPSNYVQKYDSFASTNNVVSNITTSTNIESINTAVAETAQIDNEVSQITESKLNDKSPDYSSSNTQTLRGNKKPEIASVIAPYQATSPEQLSLQRGQLIMIRKKTDSGWWEGELQAKGRKRQVGWFPASYVKVLNSSGRTSGRTTPVSTTRVQQEIIIDKVVALYPYTAANPDELSFLKDDIISVTVREEPSWWRGELNGVSGLFPSNYVTPLQQCNRIEDKMRQDCINELIQTEKAYIDDMMIVYEVFEAPLKQSRVINQDQMNAIFVNWQEILQCNHNFLQSLVERWTSGSDVIGDVICRHLPLMTAYITFCSKQLEGAALLQKLTESSVAFRNIVRQCQSHRSTRGMPLSSFLIKPMQRITRYPLLITKILENTPATHEDYSYLVEALQIADRFLKRINENVRLKENEERLQWLQSNIHLNDLQINFNSSTNKLGPRKLLHYGVLTKVKSGKELVGFLLNDFFMLVQPSKCLGTQFNFQRNSNIIYKVYKHLILVQDLKSSKVSSEHIDSDTDANRVLKIQDGKHVISLLTSSANDCSLWLKRIDSAKDIYSKVMALTKVRPKSSPHVGVSCGRLLVLLQEGTRFIRAGKSNVDNVYCKVFLGDQEQSTNVATDNVVNGNTPLQNGVPQVPTLIWNYSMQFLLKNINEETLVIVVYEMCPFQPDEFMGRAELKVSDIYYEAQNTNGPITKKLILHQVESGEIVIKVDLQMFTNDY